MSAPQTLRLPTPLFPKQLMDGPSCLPTKHSTHIQEGHRGNQSCTGGPAPVSTYSRLWNGTLFTRSILLRFETVSKKKIRAIFAVETIRAPLLRLGQRMW